MWSKLILSLLICACARPGRLHPWQEAHADLYVCSAAKCQYNDDSWVYATMPDDAGPCVTKWHPCRTLSGVKSKIIGGRFQQPIVVQLGTPYPRGVYAPADLGIRTPR